MILLVKRRAMTLSGFPCVKLSHLLWNVQSETGHLEENINTPHIKKFCCPEGERVIVECPTTSNGDREFTSNHSPHGGNWKLIPFPNHDFFCVVLCTQVNMMFVMFVSVYPHSGQA